MKGKAVKVQIAGHTFPSIGSVSASQDEDVQEATSFVAACYGETNPVMIDVRLILLLASVTPTTDESFLLNAKLPQFQLCIWRQASAVRPT